MRSLFKQIPLLFAATLPTSIHAADLLTLTPACETALALSAAPRHLWSAAGVYILGQAGYEQVRASNNGYHCIVERNGADSLIPQCFDSSATQANLAVILDEGRLLRAGHDFTDIATRREQALATGRYPTAGPGVAYMISAFNYVYDSTEGVYLHVAPHLMFHAPNLSAAAVGADAVAALANRGLPIMNAIGPHGFMVSFVEHPSDSSEVNRACTNQLPDAGGMVPFPPQP